MQLSSVSGPVGTASYGYDGAGRVRTTTRGGVTTTLDYDSKDRVVSATRGGATTSWAYDAEGRRVGVTDGSGSRDVLVAPSMGGGYESPHLVVDGSTGARVYGYVYAGEHAVMRYDDAGATWYLRDAMGSVIGLVDDSGALVGEFEYDAFGALPGGAAGAALPSASAGDFRFQGMWMDAGRARVRANRRERLSVVSSSARLALQGRPRAYVWLDIALSLPNYA